MKPVFMNRGKTVSLVVLAATLLSMEGFSQDPDFNIFLAFGQSNMEGYPEVQAQDKTGVDSRFQLLPAVDWPNKTRTKGTWTTAVPPLCRSSTGLCPCDYFGRTLVDSLPEKIKIGIINVSVAGCAIEMFDKDKYQSYISTQPDWMKNIVNEYDGNPYARLVEIGKLAQKNGVIKGFLLHQGESGSSTNQWANEVKTIYNNLINDLGLDPSKTPLLTGDLLSPSKMVQDLPKTLQNSYVISSQGLNGRDQWHFTAESYREFGKRYALKMLDILRNQETGVAEGRVKTGIGYTLGNSVEYRNGKIVFSFEIPQRAFVTLKAYTLGGKEIAGLAGSDYAAGKHAIELWQKAMPTGLLILTMKSGPFMATRAILVGAK
jgi:hypothetical protein